MHTHKNINAPEEGKIYTCIMNGVPLYDAEVQRAQGCWATIKVLQPKQGKYEKHYKEGQVMDIKVQYYEFMENK